MTINIDRADEDWIKRGSWDIPADNIPDLREWLYGQRITVAQFKQMPVYLSHLDSMPWLTDL